MFKQAIVTPLLKKPGLDQSDPSNYRPISNLNNISKLLERLFLFRFQSHVSNSPNFNPLQSAYRRFQSTETSLLNTLDQVYTAADSSQPTILVSLDLSAAFDTIDHHILLTRLQTGFGISGSVINWIRSYLDRQGSEGCGWSIEIDRHLAEHWCPSGFCAGPNSFFGFHLSCGSYHQLIWNPPPAVC